MTASASAPTALLVLIDGFEEIEALATVDVLRRGGVDVTTVSLTDSLTVTGGHNIPVVADALLADVDTQAPDVLIIPGGTTAVDEHEGLKEAVVARAEKDARLAAICAAPMVLGNLGLLEGKNATCYPGFEKYLMGASVHETPAVVDGSIITGRGPGWSVEFALTILAELKGVVEANEVRSDLLLAPSSQNA